MPDDHPVTDLGTQNVIDSVSIHDVAGRDITTQYGAAFSEVLRFLEQEAQFRRLLVDAAEKNAEHLSAQIESLDKRVRHGEQDLDIWRRLDSQERIVRRQELDVWMLRTNTRIAWMMAGGLVLMLIIVCLLALHVFL